MCHWVCVIGNIWACDKPAGGCTCPEEEHCDPPTRMGYSGETDTTPCLPIGGT